MLAILYVLFGVFCASIFLISPNQELQNNQESMGKTIASNLWYYQTEAQINCLPADGSNRCQYNGIIKGLPTRKGADNLLTYGSNIKSWTDGSTFIATTVCGDNLGKINLNTINSWVVKSLYNDNSNTQIIGHWSNGKIVMNNVDDNNMSVYHKEYTIDSLPCSTMYNNQPILYGRILN